MRSFSGALRLLCGRIVIAVLVCALIVSAAVVQINRYIDDQVAKVPRIAVSTAATGATGASSSNFLIIGSDTRSFVKSEADRRAFTDANTTTNGPARSDTMMVLHAAGKSSYAVSFPRDLWVDIPGHGTEKLNAAFNGGPQKLIDTIKTDFNVDINHYLEFNFKTFQDLVNSVGSIPVYFPYPARDQYSGLGPTWVAGCYHLDGAPALAYVRSRHLEYMIHGVWKDASGLSDIDRIQRQQDFIRKLGALVVRTTLHDPLIAPDLAHKMIPNLTADTGFGRDALNQLVQAFRGLADGQGNGPTFATLPWTQARRRGQDVLLVKQPEAGSILAVLRGEAPVPTPSVAPSATASTAVQPRDVQVKVLNASGIPGAAATASQTLTRMGFQSGGSANDPRGRIDHSEVRYKPGHEAQARLIATSIPDAQLVTDPSLPATDIVVALGTTFRGVRAPAPGAAPATAATATAAPTPEQACT